MAATVKNVERSQGDTFAVDVTILKADGTPYDLTGVTEIKLGVAEGKALLQTDTPTFVSTGTVTTPLDGTASFPIDAAAAAITPKKYNAEIQFIQGGFIVTTKQFTYTVIGQIIY